MGRLRWPGLRCRRVRGRHAVTIENPAAIVHKAAMAKDIKAGPRAGLAARRAALFALQAVLKGAGLEAALAEQLTRNRIEDHSDRGFARTLLLALLRHGRIAEARLAPYLADASALPAPVHHLLWLGYVQLQVLDGKPHAVLDTATELAKTIEKGRYAKLVNAVLRRATELQPLPLEAQGLPGRAPWLRDRWVTNYGAETAARIAAQLLAPVPLDVTVKTEAAGWAAQAGGTVIGSASICQTVRLPPATEVTGLPGFQEGAFWVQDAAAALPLSLIGDLTGKRALDIGAAPGGKTAQLCQAGAPNGTNVTALDISQGRMARLAENMQRLGFAPELVVADARTYEPAAPFDLILLDAPCSATGTLRRHPELDWQKGEADVLRLAGLQAVLLDRAAHWLTPQGELLFLTCSLEPEEGEGQVAAFLERHPDFTLVPFAQPPFGRVTDAGALRILPCDIPEGGCDGFFAARLTRR